MHESDAHPVHHQTRRAFADLAEPAQQSFIGVAADVRKIPIKGEINQPVQQCCIATRGRKFEVPEPRERRCDAADDGPRLGDRIAIVEHVAHDNLACGYQRECAGGRYPQMVHCLAAQKFAN